MSITNTSSIWDRRTADPSAIIPDRFYNLAIGLVLTWGFVVNAVMVRTIDPRIVLAVPWLALFVGYMICSFVGMYVLSASDNPIISFLGYNLVVIPMGLLLTPVIAFSDALIVQRAMVATGGVTLSMMLLGTMYPGFFLSIGRGLAVALLIGILVQLALMLFGLQTPSLLDGLFVLIFSGYIGYDWARANQLPKTLDNAIDASAALYLDIVNLFLRILRLLSRR
jgi:FtsH-binding integral membrane protein